MLITASEGIEPSVNSFACNPAAARLKMRSGSDIQALTRSCVWSNAIISRAAKSRFLRLNCDNFASMRWTIWLRFGTHWSAFAATTESQIDLELSYTFTFP